MTEQELMEKIKSSAEEIEIPEEISPESMKKKLEGMEQGNGAKKHWYAGKNAAVAAAILLMCGVGVTAAYRTVQGDKTKNVTDESMDMASASDMDMAEQESAAAGSAENAQITEAEAAGDEAAADTAVHEKSDAGELYVVAKDYGDIYDVLKAEYDITYGSDMRWGAASDTAGVEEATDGAMMEDAVKYESAGMVWDMAASGSSTVKEQQQETSKQELDSYSKTNLQMEGVDESDIIKTDGSYIYIVNGHAVKIIDIQGDKMKEIGEIDISLDSAADRVMEMYVDGDKLNLIVEKEQTQLNQSTAESTSENQDSAIQKNGTEETVVQCDVYYMDSDIVTELQTYDISNRKEPILKGSITQDGMYKTSRKIGDIVYLFTEKSMQMPGLAREQAVLEKNTGDWIPLVNGTAIAADCIYIPEQGSNGLVVSSVNVDKPDKIVDNTLIMNNYVNIYVSTEALYLYGQDYSGSGVVTQIAKFGLKEGVIDAVGATSAAGAVYDTFAINEYRGKLRLLTTDWSQGENENNLYLFDEELKLTGSLKGIAKGEEIYAARYFGDTVYFVTYRNTDPLFAVDLSDEKKPKILSELKITGFSEYLHFWGNDKLVGIGYETDPDSGERKGIKLTMFDISNPAELKTLGTCVIENLDYSPALYNYKCVLADAGENVIGFAAESYGRDYKCSYLLFSWENGKFKELMTETISQNTGLDTYRGLYVGDSFYLASPVDITSYDREQGYKKLENLEL